MPFAGENPLLLPKVKVLILLLGENVLLLFLGEKVLTLLLGENVVLSFFGENVLFGDVNVLLGENSKGVFRPKLTPLSRPSLLQVL